MSAASDPIREFAAWFEQASVLAPFDPTAMALATADGAGRPSVRWVLLRGFDERGFVFFTNYESRKADELAANPRAALAIHWPWVERQVRIEGRVERLDEAASDEYFRGRPRGHQIGAWASRQSRPLADPAELSRRVAEFTARFAAAPVPRPPFWGGFRIAPEAIELWRGRPDRLHERRRFELVAGIWRETALYP